MPNIRLIPVDFVVERAIALKTAAEALPLRRLLSDWFVLNNQEAEGYAVLRDIDDHFPSAMQVGLNGEAESEPVVLDGCVLSRYRNNQTDARMLVAIIHEIHRRMNIPAEQSRMAKREEDKQMVAWSWPHVMRVMVRHDIIFAKTKKSVFGAMIEQVLGDKVAKNSIRRVNSGDYSIVEVSDFKLSQDDKDVIRDISKLFLPLLKPRNDSALPND